MLPMLLHYSYDSTTPTVFLVSLVIIRRHTTLIIPSFIPSTTTHCLCLYIYSYVSHLGTGLLWIYNNRKGHLGQFIDICLAQQSSPLPAPQEKMRIQQASIVETNRPKWENGRRVATESYNNIALYAFHIPPCQLKWP